MSETVSAEEESALVLSGSNAMALPETWFRNQIDTLKDLIAKDCNDEELSLFAKVCKMRGLNPFSKQIYAVKIMGKMSVQVGIDGLRLIAQRSGEYEGQTATQWCGPDMVWHDVWLNDEAPAAARVGVYRKGFREPVYGIATFKSYASKYKKNGKETLTPMWVRMPEVMLAKCAEALALRKAFPQETEGLYTPEEMAQAGNPVPDQRPSYDPFLKDAGKQEQDSIRKRIWVLADQVLGREDKEAKLYSFGSRAKLIWNNPEGRPSLSWTPRSHLLELIERMQKAVDKKRAEAEASESPSNDVKKPEQPPAEEVAEAEYTPKEDAPTADTVALKMRLEKLESELSQIDTMEKRKAWYADQFEACEEKMEAAFGEGFANGYLPPWDKKAKRPDWATATNEQLNNWLNWLVDLAAAS